MKAMFDDLKDQMNSRFDSVSHDINLIKMELAETKGAIHDLETCVNMNENQIKKVEKEIIPKVTSELEKKNRELEDKITLMELHQRKQNLLLYGVEEERNEDINMIVHGVFAHFLGLDPNTAEKIPLINVHRLPTPQHDKQRAGPRPIITRFVKMADRDRILSAFERPARLRGAPPGPIPVQQPQQQQPQPDGRAGLASDHPQPDGHRPVNELPGSQQAAGLQSQPLGRSKFTRVAVRSDLPAIMKRERGRIASLAYKLRQEKKVSTRIRINGTRVYLQTRKPVQSGAQEPWKTWDE